MKYEYQLKRQHLYEFMNYQYKTIFIYQFGTTVLSLIFVFAFFFYDFFLHTFAITSLLYIFQLYLQQYPQYLPLYKYFIINYIKQVITSKIIIREILQKNTKITQQNQQQQFISSQYPSETLIYFTIPYKQDQWAYKSTEHKQLKDPSDFQATLLLQNNQNFIENIKLSFLIDLDNNFCQVFTSNNFVIQGDSQLVDIFSWLSIQCNKKDLDDIQTVKLYFFNKNDQGIYNLSSIDYELIKKNDFGLEVMKQLAFYCFKKIQPSKIAVNSEIYRMPPHDTGRKFTIFQYDGEKNSNYDKYYQLNENDITYVSVQDEMFKKQQIYEIYTTSAIDNTRCTKQFINSQEISRGNGKLKQVIKPLVQQINELLNDE